MSPGNAPQRSSHKLTVIRSDVLVRALVVGIDERIGRGNNMPCICIDERRLVGDAVAHIDTTYAAASSSGAAGVHTAPTYHTVSTR
jgi:hypothetical protein